MKKSSLVSFFIFFLCILVQQPGSAANLVNWGDKYFNTKHKHLEIQAYAEKGDNGQTTLELLFYDNAKKEDICQFSIPISKKNALKAKHRFFALSLSPDGKKLTVSKAPNAKIPKNDCAKNIFGTYINSCPQLDTEPKTITITLKELEWAEVGTLVTYIHDGKEEETWVHEGYLDKNEYKRNIGKTIKAQYINSQYIDFELQECVNNLFFIKFYDSNTAQ